MKAVSDCIENITDKTKEEQKVYVQHILDQNYDEIRGVIEFDDDLF